MSARRNALHISPPSTPAPKPRVALQSIRSSLSRAPWVHRSKFMIVGFSLLLAAAWTWSLRDREFLLHLVACMHMRDLPMVSQRSVLMQGWQRPDSAAGYAIRPFPSSTTQFCTAVKDLPSDTWLHKDLASIHGVMQQLVSRGVHLDRIRTLYRTAFHDGDHEPHDVERRLAKAASGNSSNDEPLLQLLKTATSMLSGTGRIFTCKPDSFLEQAAWNMSIPSNRYLVAANFFNNQQMLPNFIQQVIRLATLLPHGSVYVSIYESGSTDQTGIWLSLLKLLLCPLEVPYNITIGGTLTRRPDEEGTVDRIGFLAQVRNAALAPVLDGRPALQQQPPAQQSLVSTWWSRVMGRSPPELAPDTAPKPPALFTKVLFLNDIFFCMEDMLRLLLHTEQQHLACGIDLHTNGMFRAADRRRLWLYDSWVSRDILGGMITGDFPVMSDPVGTARARQGLPFAVHCCWNGMVAMDAAPFYRGVKVRSAMPGECRASECSLLCDDFHRLGFQRMVIDPMVRVTYKYHHALAVQHVWSTYDPQRQLASTTWADVVAAGPVPEASPKYDSILCCSKKVESDSIPWELCHPSNIMAVNFTEQAFAAQLAKTTNN